MAYSLAYIGSFLNNESTIANADNQQQVDIYIYDTETAEADSPNDVFELEMADNPLRFVSINNNEDKFEVVRSTKAEFSIHSTDSVTIDTFAGGGDNRWKVEVYYTNVLKFVGWLSISDLSQDFMPNPNVINLVATDGLSFLDNEALTDFDGDVPQNEHQQMDYLMWALGKTGLQLPVWCVFNIRERYATPLISDDSGDGHYFKHEWLDAKTFEADIGTLESAKTVIEKILKKEAYIKQWNGVWIIIRVDEIVSTLPLYCFKFEYDGTFIEQAELVLDKVVAANALCSWMNDDAVKSLETRAKSVKLTYNYNYPSEIPCNRDFSRGTGSAPTGAASETIDLTLDCWEYLREDIAYIDIDSPPFAGSTGVLRKIYEFGYEKERYLVSQTAGGFRHYFKSSDIFLQAKDKFTIGYQFRLSTSESVGNIYTSHIRLTGDDGFLYDLNYDSANPNAATWHQKGPTDPIFDDEVLISWSGESTLEWKSLSATAPPLPVSGVLNIRLLNQSTYIQHFSDLTLDITPYINGSYQRYTGQYFKVTQPTDPDKYKLVIEDEVFISDAPRRAMKGCLLKTDSPGFTLTQGFYSAQVFPNADYPSSDYIHPYGYLQLYDVWNQNNRVMTKFEGEVDHLDEDTDILDPVHVFYLYDADPSTNGKVFMLLHMDQDVHLCETKVFFHEVFDENIPKEYPASEFKYITQ